MTFEQRCIAHYSSIKRRIAYPAKRPIVFTDTAPKPKPRAETGRPARNMPHAEIYRLWKVGTSNERIGQILGIGRKMVSRYIIKQGWEK